MGNTNHKGYESVETYDETNKLNQTDSNVYNNKGDYENALIHH